MDAATDSGAYNQGSSELPYEDDAIPHHHPPAVPGSSAPEQRDPMVRGIRKRRTYPCQTPQGQSNIAPAIPRKRILLLVYREGIG